MKKQTLAKLVSLVVVISLVYFGKVSAQEAEVSSKLTTAGERSGWKDDGEVVRLRTSTDKVGIGTTDPESYKLKVAGDVRIGDNLHSSNQGLLIDGILGLSWGTGVGTPATGNVIFKLKQSLQSKEKINILGPPVVSSRIILNYYVALNGDDNNPGTIEKPFKTLEKARNTIKELKARGRISSSINVYIREGIYYLDESFKLSSEDSGEAGKVITYQACPGEKVVLSGGRKLANDWAPYSGSIYALDVGDMEFSALYVNGKRAVRARTPNTGYYTIALREHCTQDYWNAHPAEPLAPECFNSFNAAPGNINAGWRNLNDVEIISLRRFQHAIGRISSVIGNTVAMQNSLDYYYYVFYGWDYEGTDRYYAENVFEGLDSPGEWYLDKTTGTLYYWPLPDESMATAEVIAPALARILEVGDYEAMERWINGEGSEETFQGYVSNVNFKGIEFMHTDRILPDIGYAGSQTAGAVEDAAVTLIAINSIFENNKIALTGSHGIDAYSKNTQIIRNEIRDIGANGIKIGKVVYNNHENYGTFAGDFTNYERVLSLSESNTISDNTIHDFGQVWKEGAGIFLGLYGKNKISHNLVYNGPYTGISAGWFTHSVFGPYYTQDNIVEYNEVHHVMQELQDGGGIYMLGKQPGTVVQNNKVYDIMLTDNHVYRNHGRLFGIYVDSSSQDMLVRNNVVYRTAWGGIMMNSAADGNMNNAVENNIFVDGETFQAYLNSASNDVFRKNIIYYKLNPGSYIFFTPQANSIGESDYNLFYSPDNLPNVNYLLDIWKAFGFDAHSAVADPLFVDYTHDNFNLQAGSPAFGLGFEPIDLSSVGPR